jgi:hypothetical protein
MAGMRGIWKKLATSVITIIAEMDVSVIVTPVRIALYALS